MPRSDALLSWNMKCGERAKSNAVDVDRRLNLLTTMVSERSLSLIALQESPAESEVRKAVGLHFATHSTIGGVVTAYDSRRWSCDHVDVSRRRVAILGLRAVGAGLSVWILNVHGPAERVTERSKRDFMVGEVVKSLQELRARDERRSNIVVGDLNMPPFDESLVRQAGLNANRCLPWVQQRVSGVNRALFNPTWRLMGRELGPSGTFYTSYVELDGPWHALDQVAVSADLAQDPIFGIEIIERVGAIALRKSGRAGAPDPSVGSDHLPVLATLSVL